MANKNEVTQSDFTFEELEDAFYELMHDFKKIKLENRRLKEDISLLSNDKEKFFNINEKLTLEIKCLKNQNLELNNENDLLSKENLALKNELKNVKPFVEKFTYSSEKLDMLLNNQRAIFNKAGLEYKS